MGRTTPTTRSQPATPTRRAIVNRLKERGPQDAESLAADLGVSAMAVRQHLYAMRDEGLIAADTPARPAGSIGRPAKQWRLTQDAEPMFPDHHAELTVSLITCAREAFGTEGLDRLIAARAKHQAAGYKRRMPRGASLRRRLCALAAIRTEEGYMADVIEDGADLLLVENHCPICAAAKACVGLCGAELDVFRAVLGRDVHIERVEHMIDGARRCAYRATKRRKRG